MANGNGNSTKAQPETRQMPGSMYGHVEVPTHGDVARMTEVQAYAFINSHEQRHAPQPAQSPLPGQALAGHHLAAAAPPSVEELLAPPAYEVEAQTRPAPVTPPAPAQTPAPSTPVQNPPAPTPTPAPSTPSA